MMMVVTVVMVVTFGGVSRGVWLLWCFFSLLVVGVIVIMAVMVDVMRKEWRM